MFEHLAQHIPVAFCSLVTGAWVGADVVVVVAPVVPVVTGQHGGGGEGVVMGPISNPNLGDGSSASPPYRSLHILPCPLPSSDFTQGTHCLVLGPLKSAGSGTYLKSCNLMLQPSAIDI